MSEKPIPVDLVVHFQIITYITNHFLQKFISQLKFNQFFLMLYLSLYFKENIFFHKKV